MFTLGALVFVTMKENQRKCLKCGSSPVSDPETTLFRFPKPGSPNSLRCELWEKYCSPDKPWSNKDFQLKLYSEHRMLCHRHFKETAFVDFTLKKLRGFTAPDVDTTVPFLPVNDVREPVAGPSQALSDITNRNVPGPSEISNPNRRRNPIASPVENKNFLKCKQYLQIISNLKKVDSHEAIINNYKLLLNKSNNQSNNHNEEASTSSLEWKFNKDDIHPEVLEESGELQACAYVCGFMIKNYKNECKKCITHYLQSSDK